MKLTVTNQVEREVNITELRLDVGPRYWEDSTVNGIEDTEDGANIPCKDEDRWCPVIEIDTGKILNWEQGKTADIHYKVCDDGGYTIFDDAGAEFLFVDNYVPKTLCPNGEGYGDYIIMTIDENGFIENWKFNIDDFH